MDVRVECQRTDAFELWYWRRLLRVPWTARRSNYSILKKFSPEYSLERLMLKLNLQCFGHLIQRIDSLEKTLMLEKSEGWRRRVWQDKIGWHHQLDGHEFEQAPRVGNGQGSLVCYSPMGSQRVRHDWATELNLSHLMYFPLHLWRKISWPKENMIQIWILQRSLSISFY